MVALLMTFMVSRVYLIINNKVRMNTFMLNGYYDFYNESLFTLYVCVSMALANLKLENKTYEGDVQFF